MIKKIIFLILVILWMGIIFYFSSFDGSKSTSQSRGLLNRTIGYIVSKLDIDNKEEIIESLEYPIRKVAHVSEYFILCIFVCLFIGCFDISISKTIVLSFIVCVLYSCSDEIHQLYINGRNGNVIDVLIDSIGISIYLIIYYLFRRKACLK